MKILLIDDDAIVLHSLKLILESQGVVILATAPDGSQLTKLYREHRPDVVLMDIQMKPVGGLEASRKLLEDYPDAKVLLLSTFEDSGYIREALEIGCKGYLLKENFSGILPALESVHAGSMVFDPAMILSLQQTPKGAELSKRERELIRLVAKGKSNKEVAEELFLSEGTVRNYLSTILEKLDLRDRTQLAIFYYQHPNDLQ